MLSEGEEKTQNRQGRGRSRTLEVKQPGGEQDRRATTKPALSPDSRWGGKVEPALRKVGSGPGRKWVKVMSQYAELFVGIDVAKRTLEVALSSGERLSIVNDDAGIAKLVQDLVKRAPALVVLGPPAGTSASGDWDGRRHIFGGPGRGPLHPLYGGARRGPRRS